MANVFDALLNRMVNSVAQQAGAHVASSPEIQATIAQAKAEYDKAQTLLWVGGALAVTAWMFYFLPRFESPLPRIWRRRK